MTKTVTTREVSVQAKYIAMLAPFISKEESRYYLRGVYVTPHPSKPGVILAATDGHRLGIIYDETGHANCPWICPVDKAVVAACKKKPKKNDFRAGPGTCRFIGDVAMVCSNALDKAVEESGKDPKGLSEHHLAYQYSPPIDGTYVDIWRVVPTELETTPDPVTLNPQYVADFVNVGKFSSIQHVSTSIYSREEGAPAVVFVDGVPEFIGVIMPMRGGRNHEMPEWISGVGKEG